MGKSCWMASLAADLKLGSSTYCFSCSFLARYFNFKGGSGGPVGGLLRSHF